MPAYSVAVYSAEKCTFYDPSKAAEWVDLLSSDDPLPNSSRLASIQQTLSFDGVSNLSRILVLVPDSWLSVSQHRIDHFIPSPLLPLAALSYAVETTFSPPESLVLYYYQKRYQQAVLSTEQVQLTVFACSAEWAEQLCSPFQSLATPQSSVKPCLLMSQKQWIDIQPRARSWSCCLQRALLPYQPEKAKRQRTRRLWAGLLMLSVFIHSMAVFYFFSLERESQQTLVARQQLLAAQSAWSSAQEVNGITESVLTLVQTMPDSVRLEHVESRVEDGVKQAFFQITLPKKDLDLLLGNWREQYPDWRWEIEQQPHSLSLAMNQKEVVDASIKVFEK